MRRLAVLIAVLSLALGLVACGDADDSASGESEAGATTATEGTRASEKPSKKNEQRDGKGYRRAEDSPRPSAERNTGGKFTSADGSGKIHGDGSIERYGEDGSEDEFNAAAEAAGDYYAAMIAKDFEAACHLIAPKTRETFEKMSQGRPALEGKDCADIVEGFMGMRPRAQLRQVFDPRTRFTGLRVKDDQAFLLLTSPEIKAGTIPMVRDDGGWKVGALNASPL